MATEALSRCFSMSDVPVVIAAINEDGSEGSSVFTWMCPLFLESVALNAKNGFISTNEMQLTRKEKKYHVVIQPAKKYIID